jgi:Na+/melibiose symporter-like transporter
MSIIPAAMGVLAIIIVLFYKLDEKTMQKVETDLEARRKKIKDEALEI